MTSAATAPSHPFVDVRGLTFGYSDDEAEAVLHDITLSVAEGEFLAIEGPTGSGKTTLCLALNGIIPHATPGVFRGDVTIGDRNTKRATVPELAREVGVVYQDAESQLFGLTAEEDIAFGLENLGMSRPMMIDRVRWALDATDLVGLERKAPSSLSGGQKQRLAIAGVLAMRPRVMVLDEPTAELDPVGKQEILRVVRRLCEDFSLTVVLVEHECEFIADYADRVALLKDGRIISVGSSTDTYSWLTAHPELPVRAPQVSTLSRRLESLAPATVTLNRGPLPVATRLDQMRERLDAALDLTDKDPRRRDAHRAEAPASSDPPLGSGPIISVEDAVLTYPDGTQALRGVSFSLAAGEYVALIGQNGSGKTTLARLLNGLLKATRGRVLLRGLDTAPRSVAELSRSVGYVFQNPDHQLFADSVEAELRYGLVNNAVPTNEHEDRIIEALRLCGVERLRHEHPLFTSRGERQLIAVASVVAMRPDLIVFDEPTTGLDERYHRLMTELLAGLHANGHTLVVISHDMRLVAENARRTVVLHQGRVLLDGPTPIVFENVELLRRTEILPPQITQLSQLLAPHGVLTALSVEQLFDQLAQGLGGRPDALSLALGLDAPTEHVSGAMVGGG